MFSYVRKKIEFLNLLPTLILGMLLDSISTIINKNITEYNSKINEKYGINLEELSALWSEVSGSAIKKKS